MFFNKIKESVIRRRVNSACENLDIAKNAEAVLNSSMQMALEMYKQVFTAIPLIEDAVKRHPSSIADVVIEGDKIVDSLVKISETLKTVFESENTLPKQIEKSMEKSINVMERKFQKEIDSRGKRITENLSLIKNILTGKRHKRAA